MPEKVRAPLNPEEGHVRVGKGAHLPITFIDSHLLEERPCVVQTRQGSIDRLCSRVKGLRMEGMGRTGRRGDWKA
eukprot:465143-Hanusia_phi.AAC.2